MAVSWPGLRWREVAAGDARATIAEAYEFLVDSLGTRRSDLHVRRRPWCLLRPRPDPAARHRRRAARPDGLRARRLCRAPYASQPAGLATSSHCWPRDWPVTAKSVFPYSFWGSGTWRTCRVGTRTREPLTNVVAGRHAVAIDGRHGPRHLVSSPESVDEVWFRGAHCDVAGGPRGMLAAGGHRAGLDARRRDSGRRHGAARQPPCEAPTPSEYDALAGSARTISLRRLPASPLVHASVDIYLRAHPEYWRRLPAQVVWADTDWLARSERLVHAEPAAAVEPAVLTAAAS